MTVLARDEKSFTDVTIACDGQSCKAHKMILSACSPYFKVGLLNQLLTARLHTGNILMWIQNKKRY
jgi:hypothetical protein